MNPELAAIQSGYSKKGARKTAWRLLQDKQVQARIKELKGNIDTLTYIEATDLLNRHNAIVHASLSDYVYVDVKKDRYGNTKVKIIPKDNFNDLPLEYIQEMTNGKDGFKIKLVDKNYSEKVLDRWFGLDKDYELKKLVADRNHHIAKEKLKLETEIEDHTQVIKQFLEATKSSKEELDDLFDDEVKELE
jgi:hypothetical protein